MNNMFWKLGVKIKKKSAIYGMLLITDTIKYM